MDRLKAERAAADRQRKATQTQLEDARAAVAAEAEGDTELDNAEEIARLQEEARELETLVGRCCNPLFWPYHPHEASR